jgi:hypothetical protein
MGLVNELAGQGDPSGTQQTNNSASNSTNNSAPATNRTNATNETNRTPPPAPTGASGTCRCAPSGLAAFGTGFATPEQIRLAESSCTGARAGARFDRASFTCTGPTTETECRALQPELNRQLPTGISAECTWTR